MNDYPPLDETQYRLAHLAYEDMTSQLVKTGHVFSDRSICWLIGFVLPGHNNGFDTDTADLCGIAVVTGTEDHTSYEDAQAAVAAACDHYGAPKVGTAQIALMHTDFVRPDIRGTYTSASTPGGLRGALKNGMQ